MTDANTTQPDVHPRGHCYRCGYDLRGIKSDACPECGMPATVPIEIPDAQQFHLARAALERDGLLVRFTNPGGSIGTIGILAGGNLATPGYLYVDSRHAEAIEKCLGEAGVPWVFGALPIVDRAEPRCPTCGGELDPAGPEVCRTCGAAFQWVEIEGEPAILDGDICAHCGYELRTRSGGTCPECGHEIIVQYGEAVAPEVAIVREADPVPPDAPAREQPPAARRRMSLLFALMLIVPVVLMVMSGLTLFLDLEYVVAGAVIVGIPIVVVWFLRSPR
ncbi:MAG: hypothetical protein ACYTGG_07830 [Planctomycetota bacterium]|jgi:hypothetical protein